MRLIITLMLLFFSTSLQAAQELTQANITAKVAAGQVNINHPTPHTMTRRVGFFKVLDLIKNGTSPATELEKGNLITELRNSLDHQYLPANLTSIDEKAVDYIKNRLVQEEINLFRRFGSGTNFMPTYHTEQNLYDTTKGLSSMTGRLMTENGHGTGTLIAVPNGHGGHKWAVLTCGHILDDIGCSKDDAADNDNLTFQLKALNGAVVNLPIKQIKVFKRDGKSVQIKDIGPPHHENPQNSASFPDHIRALPRYDLNGDLALCFFDEHQMIGGQNIPAYLDHQFPVTTQPVLHANPLTFTITKAGHAITYSLPFVDNDQNPLIIDINGRIKAEMFALGYAAFENEELPTLSGARNIDRNHIYPAATINANAGQSTAYNFFHDIPTYSGMSGGPIFHVDNAANNVTIFGVVLGHNDEDGPNIANVAEKSRCEGTFLKQNLLQ